MHKVGLYEKSRLAAAASPDNKDIFIPCILWLLWAAVHGKPFRLCEQHVILKYRVGVGLYIFGVAPTGRAVFDTFPVFLRILAFYIDNQPDKDSPYNTDKQIHRCKARKRVCKGSGKAVCKGKHLAGQVSPRREPHRLSDFVKEIDKEQIGGI